MGIFELKEDSEEIGVGPNKHRMKIHETHSVEVMDSLKLSLKEAILGKKEGERGGNRGGEELNSNVCSVSLKTTMLQSQSFIIIVMASKH